MVSSRLAVEPLEDRTVPSTLTSGALVAPPSSVPTSGLVSSADSTQQLSFHVDGTFQILYTHGSDLGASAAGTLSLGNQTLTFTTTVDVKHSGDNIQGTPTFVFNDGSTLTFSYDIKLDNSTGIFSGTWTVTSGTGLFASASGGGTISYPLSPTGTGPLTMDGTISL
jgi:hypothetical protein